MVLQFITEVLSPYFENRILNTVLGKRKTSALKIPKIPANCIVEVEPTIFKVPGKTKACASTKSVIVHRHLHACQVFQGSQHSLLTPTAA